MNRGIILWRKVSFCVGVCSFIYNATLHFPLKKNFVGDHILRFKENYWISVSPRLYNIMSNIKRANYPPLFHFANEHICPSNFQFYYFTDVTTTICYKREIFLPFDNRMINMSLRNCERSWQQNYLSRSFNICINYTFANKKVWHMYFQKKEN